MNGLRRVVVLCAAVVALAGGPAAAHAACEDATLRPTKANADRVADAVVCLVNAQRAKRGLNDLESDRRLARAAKRHSKDMVAREYFAHVSPGGAGVLDRVKSTRYIKARAAWSLAENIGWGSGSRATPKSIVRAWMRSPGHRRNILTRGFEDAGVGVAPGTPVGISGGTYTLLFGRSR